MVKLAIIPARKGSKRFPGKNMALLGGKPLVQIAIEEAQLSGVFDRIVVSTDWRECGELAFSLGVNWAARPDEICQDDSHDFQFVEHALSIFPCDIFAILRPTSPFRTAYTIRRAMYQFFCVTADSMRAVEPVSQHPRKMWSFAGGRMKPYIPGGNHYDYGTQSFEQLCVQNGCIHIAWAKVLTDSNNVSGERIAPFFTQFPEGIDINTREDLIYATAILDAARNGDGAV